ncbi:glutamyl-tRNA reductase [Desulfallas thermosapovorans]|uniref:Glutamyl-tRNA reductase n=1 Tax=Desulfallas thermosapovorans DSM 6562 TaxID=1121431 RepID=A0A5S4ZQV9_9FIRM|nr:glutamyl-tRNA reductase [Desulfallas thermosapovorans]TYO94990.1 glutamyl-tRNA reductase [Desulfallas thermosapovorans DSM 6562]
MSVISIGVNHKTAPVEIREKLSFSDNSLPDALARLLDQPVILGCVIISTCNRTEIYAHVTDIESGIETIRSFLQHKSGVEASMIKKYTYAFTQHKTARHLFRVAAGLDSMLLGETQILGQVRTAYHLAQEYKATDKVINTLFKHAITVGKRARTETGIDQHAVSISYAAVELAKQIFHDLTGRSVLVIGAGKMSELTAKHLVANGVSGVIVSNRSHDRAECLARQFGGRAVKFDELHRYLEAADIVISCTAATHYVVRASDVQSALSPKPNKKIMMIDIAVPRDIDPAVGKIPGVTLYDIDDLQNVVDNNLMERKRAAIMAEGIIEEQVDEFVQWLDMQYVIPTVSALKKRGEEIKEREMARALGKLGNISEHDRKVIGSMANNIVNQLLHTPVTRLKEYALTEQGPLYKEAMEELFCLDDVDYLVTPNGHTNVKQSTKVGKHGKAQASQPKRRASIEGYLA